MVVSFERNAFLYEIAFSSGDPDNCQHPSGLPTSHLSGSLSDLLAPEITAYGGHIPVVHPEPALSNARWTRWRDRFGTVIESSEITFEQVDLFLRAPMETLKREAQLRSINNSG